MSDKNIETEIIHYDDGRRGEFQSLNGMRHGSRTVFNPDGAKSWQDFYVMDVQSGPDRRWYENRQIEYERNFENGELHGSWITWHMNGQIKSEAHFENGEQCGEARWYTTCGDLLAEMVISRDGKRHGSQIAEFMTQAGKGDLRLGIATYDHGEYQGCVFFDDLPEGYSVGRPA